MPVQSKYIAKGDEMLEYARQTYGNRVTIGKRVNMAGNTFYHQLDMVNGLSMNLFVGEFVLGLAVEDSAHIIEKAGRQRLLHPFDVQVPEGETCFLHKLVGLRDLKGREVDPFFVQHKNEAVLVKKRDFRRVDRVEALFILALHLGAEQA